MLPTEELEAACCVDTFRGYHVGSLAPLLFPGNFFEGSSPQVRGQLVLVWMAPWAGLEGEGREAVLTPASAPRFLYSDEVQIGPETVMTTLYTAKKYAVPALEAHCVEFLKKNLRADNAFMLLTQVQGWDAGGRARMGGRGRRGTCWGIGAESGQRYRWVRMPPLGQERSGWCI